MGLGNNIVQGNRFPNTLKKRERIHTKNRTRLSSKRPIESLIDDRRKWALISAIQKTQVSRLSTSYFLAEASVLAGYVSEMSYWMVLREGDTPGYEAVRSIFFYTNYYKLMSEKLAKSIAQELAESSAKVTLNRVQADLVHKDGQHYDADDLPSAAVIGAAILDFKAD